MAATKDPSTNPAHVASLKRDPQNARRHNARNVGMITQAMEEVGFARSIVIDEDGVVLAGEGTLEAAQHAGMTKLQVVEADGETVIAVQRKNLTPEQKRKLGLYDNRTQELSEFDPDILQQMVDEGSDLSQLWTPDELTDLLGTTEPEAVEPLTVPRPQEVAWVLLAIPLEDWPAHQDAVERLQLAAKFSTMTMRPKDSVKA